MIEIIEITILLLTYLGIAAFFIYKDIQLRKKIKEVSEEWERISRILRNQLSKSINNGEQLGESGAFSVSEPYIE